MSLPNHGANPHYFVNALGVQLPQHVIDFSENVNPLGSPQIIRDRWSQYYNTIHTYPDPDAITLREKLANDLDVLPNQLLIGNGAAELILLIASFFQKKKVLVVEPTFSEYRDACLTYGCEVERFLLHAGDGWNLQLENLLEVISNVDVLFLCHPNNPTGTTLQLAKLTQILKRAKERNVTVVIDEAFYDFCVDSVSMISYIRDFHNLIILRSLTKMYAIPALRLGYVVANESMIAELRKLQQPWSVNGIAQQVGLDCISDKDHVTRTKTYIQKEREKVFAILRDYGYTVSPSKVNFYLLKHENRNEDLRPLITYLIENGIIPRHTYNFLGLEGKYIRLAVKTKESNDFLLSILKRWSGS